MAHLAFFSGKNFLVEFLKNRSSSPPIDLHRRLSSSHFLKVLDNLIILTTFVECAAHF